MQWEEPHDCALYCIQSDGNHMIASGSSYYGVVRLWDKRHTRCLQVRHLLASMLSTALSMKHTHVRLLETMVCLSLDSTCLLAFLHPWVWLLQSFQLSPSTSSPVYCLRFNTSHLYTAIATALFALDFRGHVTKVRR